MDMSEIVRTPAHQGPCWPSLRDAERNDPQRWHELVAEIGAEIAGPLTAALERINALTTTGRIDRHGLRALRDEVETARQVGMIGQQLTRLASGRLRQSHERLQLADDAQRRAGAPQRARPRRAASCVKPALEAGRGDRRCVAAVQPAQHHARLGAGECARSQHRVHDRHQDLAGACAADLPLRAPPGRPARRRRRPTPATRRARLAAPGACLQQTALDDGPAARAQRRRQRHDADARVPAHRERRDRRRQHDGARRRLCAVDQLASRSPAAMCWWCRRGARCACRSATRCATWA